MSDPFEVMSKIKLDPKHVGPVGYGLWLVEQYALPQGSWPDRLNYSDLMDQQQRTIANREGSTK